MAGSGPPATVPIRSGWRASVSHASDQGSPGLPAGSGCPWRTPRRPIVLIVDDARENVEVLADCLQFEYDLRFAYNGPEALACAVDEPPPDLILLDVMMPGMDGYEVLDRLKSDPATAAIPVVFVTAMTAIRDEVRGLALGAVDFIGRPVSPSIVRARVRSHVALAEARRQLAEQNQWLMHERCLAEDILTRLRETETFDCHKLRYVLSSVDRSNGDMLLSAMTPDRRQWVLVGDISGHGPASAVVAPLLGHVFYSQAAENGDAEALLIELNRVMFQRLPLQMFMAFALVEVNAARDRLRVWNGGMPGCFNRSGRGKLTLVGSAYYPLGLQPNLGETEAPTELVFHPRDRFYLFTDGFCECEDENGKAFGEEAIFALLAEPGPRRSVQGIWLAAARYHGSDQFRDDLTLVELRP